MEPRSSPDSGPSPRVPTTSIDVFDASAASSSVFAIGP